MLVQRSGAREGEVYLVLEQVTKPLRASGSSSRKWAPRCCQGRIGRVRTPQCPRKLHLVLSSWGLGAKWRGVSQAGHPLSASASHVWLSAHALPDLREAGGVIGQGLCKAKGGELWTLSWETKDE